MLPACWLGICGRVLFCSRALIGMKEAALVIVAAATHTKVLLHCRCCREDKSPEFVRRWVQQHIDDAQVGGRLGLLQSMGALPCCACRAARHMQGCVRPAPGAWRSPHQLPHAAILPPLQAAGKPLLMEEFGAWDGAKEEQLQYYSLVYDLISQVGRPMLAMWGTRLQRWPQRLP